MHNFSLGEFHIIMRMIGGCTYVHVVDQLIQCVLLPYRCITCSSGCKWLGTCTCACTCKGQIVLSLQIYIEGWGDYATSQLTNCYVHTCSPPPPPPPPPTPLSLCGLVPLVMIRHSQWLKAGVDVYIQC